jgi:acyl-CoA thioesterase FadM
MTFEQRIRRGDETLVEQTISAASITTEGRPTRVPVNLIAALKGER